MSRFPSYPSVTRLILAIGPSLFSTHSAHAASCRKEPACLRAFAQAEAARTPKERLVSIGALKEAYFRLFDPRLLVSIGKLQNALGQHAPATASCLQAQSQAPADAELQMQAKDCLAKASVGLAASGTPTPNSSLSTTSRAEARSGPARATVHNNINVNPQINVSPQVQVSPQFHLMQPQAPTSSVERVPVYRKWWLWTGVGLATTAVAVGLGFGLAAREPDTTGNPIYHLNQTLAF